MNLATGIRAVSLILLFVGLGPSLGEEITRTVLPDSRILYRIYEPDVRHWMHDVRSVTFQEGDLVTVNAGGCVQTGGSGKTWKRYVDPLGDNSESLYHGLILIPGSTPERIQSAISYPHKVRTCGRIPANQLFLRLGYEDDEYDDNGYYSPDEGNPPQCDGTHAWVEITVEHNGIAPQEPPPAPFDLEKPASCDNWDPNLLPINPRWGWQRTHPGQLPDARTMCLFQDGKFENSQCSTQHPAWDMPSGTNEAVCKVGTASDPFAVIQGHVNYFPAVYTGQIDWDEHSGGLFGDDDYNWNHRPPNSEGLTTLSKGYLETEFDSDETIDHFTSPWWDDFHQLVDNDNDAARRKVRERPAVVAGLIGLDCQHDCYSEIHPVFAISILVDSKYSGRAIDETYAVFVRNLGDEGFCSSLIHPFFLFNNTYNFEFPYRGRAIRAESQSAALPPQVTADLRADNPFSTATYSVVPYGGVHMQVTLPAPDDLPGMVHGEVNIHWPLTQDVTSEGMAPKSSSPVSQHLDRQSVEEVLAELSRKVSPEKLGEYRRVTAQPLHPDMRRVPLTPAKADLSTIAAPKESAKATASPSLVDYAKLKRDACRAAAAANALSNKPAYETPCNTKKPVQRQLTPGRKGENEPRKPRPASQ